MDDLKEQILDQIWGQAWNQISRSVQLQVELQVKDSTLRQAWDLVRGRVLNLARAQIWESTEFPEISK